MQPMPIEDMCNSRSLACVISSDGTPAHHRVQVLCGASRCERRTASAATSNHGIQHGHHGCKRCGWPKVIEHVAARGHDERDANSARRIEQANDRAALFRLPRPARRRWPTITLTSPMPTKSTTGMKPEANGSSTCPAAGSPRAGQAKAILNPVMRSTRSTIMPMKKAQTIAAVCGMPNGMPPRARLRRRHAESDPAWVIQSEKYDPTTTKSPRPMKAPL